MLRLALLFLVISLVAALFGFGGVTTVVSVEIARIVFFVFLVMFAVALIGGLMGQPGNAR